VQPAATSSTAATIMIGDAAAMAAHNRARFMRRCNVNGYTHLRRCPRDLPTGTADT
jgi:hypothetical protein